MHECHLGLTKTKALLRKKIWLPQIDQLVKDSLAKCIPCQAVGKSKPPESMTMTSMPKGPWEVIHADFYGPLPSGEHLLVVIDRYSRYPSTKACSSGIPKFDQGAIKHGRGNAR